MRDGMPIPAPFPTTRWSLLGPAADGGAAVLVDLYADAVAAYLRGKLAARAPASDVDDVIQDVLMHLLQRPDLLAQARPGEGSRFRHYLMALAWNEARNALRRRRPSGQPLPEEPASDAAPGESDRAWARSVLDQAWREVAAWCDGVTAPPETLAVLRLVLGDGVALREAATRLGLSLATASRRLALGRTLLQKAIADRLRAAGELGADDPATAVERLRGYL
jgi:RNA polymerase sigma factor (sigma-70 family)